MSEYWIWLRRKQGSDVRKDEADRVELHTKLSWLNGRSGREYGHGVRKDEAGRVELHTNLSLAEALGKRVWR